MPGLLDTFIQSIKDLNSEWTKDRLKTAGGLLADFTPVVGDVKAGYEMVDSARQGNYGEAALNGLGLLPFVPAMGGATKFLMKDGKPMKVYHGSPKQFDEFDPKYIGSTTDGGDFGSGFYFSPDKHAAELYGNNVIEAYLKMDKPLVIKSLDEINVPEFWRAMDQARDRKGFDEAANALKKKGYDGVVDHSLEYPQYVVFDKDQIVTKPKSRR